MKTIKKAYAVIALASALAGGILGYQLNKPTSAVGENVDLDNDGYPDVIVKNRLGHRIPLFGVRKQNGFGYQFISDDYISAGEMNKLMEAKYHHEFSLGTIEDRINSTP